MTMNAAQTALVDAVAARLGARTVVTDPELIAPWLTDWRGRYTGAAPAILQPDGVEGVAFAVATARALGVPLVPQGGNSSMCGGATPLGDGRSLILSLRRMRAIRSLSAEAGLAVAEAGVILAELHDAAQAAGRRFPLTLGARGNATIGGLVSTNAGGTQVLRHGTMRALVAGVEAVWPDGTIHHGLPALAKDNRGYSLNQLLVGAEGTIGVVTAATLRLTGAVTARSVAWVGLSSPDSALALLRQCQAAVDAVESFELIQGETLDAAVAHVPGVRAPLHGRHRWHVLIEAVGMAGQPDPRTLIEPVLMAAIESGLAEDAILAESEGQAEALWHIRDSLSQAERMTGPATQHDIAVPVDAMPAFIVQAARACEARFAGTQASCFGHLGDGNIHFHVRAPRGMAPEHWYEAVAPQVRRFVDDLVTAAGGSISAEHGIGQLKVAALERLAPDRVRALRAVKSAFDPGNLLNPGKLVRLAPDAAAP